MMKVIFFSALLLVGLAVSQSLPLFYSGDPNVLSSFIRIPTMICLSLIMIRVGREFVIDKSNLRSYGVDYAVAFAAATLPWILCALYFVFALMPDGAFFSASAWKESLLAARFAAPTSAGVLFTLLAAAGLASTWVYRKVRVLAIFDDLDTVLLMIPLKMLIVGFAPHLFLLLAAMGLCLHLAWRFLHALNWPTSPAFLLLYAGVIVAFSEALYVSSGLLFPEAPLHLEVLLPAFALGCMLREEGPGEKHGVQNFVSAAFMFLVGLSMPALTATLQGGTSASELALSVVFVTLLSNIGKMCSFFCYTKEATWQERLAVSVAMFPRGEVGAGVLVVSLSYGIAPSVVAVAMLSLLLNLILTGVFIAIVKSLLARESRVRKPARMVREVSSFLPLILMVAGLLLPARLEASPFDGSGALEVESDFSALAERFPVVAKPRAWRPIAATVSVEDARRTSCVMRMDFILGTSVSCMSHTLVLLPETKGARSEECPDRKIFLWPIPLAGQFEEEELDRLVRETNRDAGWPLTQGSRAREIKFVDTRTGFSRTLTVVLAHEYEDLQRLRAPCP